jgi:hypothetical protein
MVDYAGQVHCALVAESSREGVLQMRSASHRRVAVFHAIDLEDALELHFPISPDSSSTNLLGAKEIPEQA